MVAEWRWKLKSFKLPASLSNIVLSFELNLDSFLHEDSLHSEDRLKCDMILSTSDHKAGQFSPSNTSDFRPSPMCRPALSPSYCSYYRMPFSFVCCRSGVLQLIQDIHGCVVTITTQNQKYIFLIVETATLAFFTNSHFYAVYVHTISDLGNNKAATTETVLWFLFFKVMPLLSLQFLNVFNWAIDWYIFLCFYYWITERFFSFHIISSLLSFFSSSSLSLCAILFL